jgi:beta-lactamase regulating signal transducer with metallopeptidase domain
VAFSLLAGTIIVTLLGSPLLARMLGSRVEPQIALVVWLVLLGCCVVSIGIAIVLLSLPGHGPAHAVMQVVHHCLAHPGVLPWYVKALSTVTSLVVGLAAARIVMAVFRQARARRVMHRRHVDTLRIVARHEPGEYPTMWLDHSVPIAYSVAGRPAMVVATSGLLDQLTHDSVAAVIAHEQAHIRGNHHLLVGLAEALAKSLSIVPFARSSPEFVRAMVELSADRSAARRCGSSSVRSALLAMSGAHLPPHALGMARGSMALRLKRLEADDGDRCDVRRWFGAGAAGLATVASSLAISTVVLIATTTVLCPFLPQ